MRRLSTLIGILIFIFALSCLTSCANMRLGTSAGVNVNFGPNGPRVDPYMNVRLYSGGRRY